MGRPRLGAEVLGSPDRQARYRAQRAAYVASLEAAVLDACVMSSILDWQARHAATIRRAFAAYREAHPEMDVSSASLFLPS